LDSRLGFEEFADLVEGTFAGSDHGSEGPDVGRASSPPSPPTPPPVEPPKPGGPSDFLFDGMDETEVWG
jgi:hypothetical protein